MARRAPAAGGPLAIVGGGIVGLATAVAALRRFPGLQVTVLEKEARVGAHQSGRNSGVVHSGVYYRPESLKARLCLEGAATIARFCEEHGLPFRRCGKLVVATEARDLPGLEEIHRRGTASGVAGLALVGPERIREIEPLCAGLRALHVPGAAITDYGAIAAALARIVEDAGGRVLTSARLTAIAERGGTIVLETTRGPVAARHAVNCAGLHADKIARLAGVEPGVRIVPFRGEYLEIAEGTARKIRGLVYPVPDPALPFLGAHLTKRIDGRATAGPNAVLALKREGYRRIDVSLADVADLLAFPGFWRMGARHWRAGAREVLRSASRAATLRSLRRLAPGLTAADLRPGGSGVRAQAVDRDGRLLDDFLIVPAGRMVHVLNVPSPAATASLAIGRTIAERLAAAFDLG